ncbi:MAG: protein-methionine-sulfoxide reductase catalytic subunit MsrP [Acidobacteria bacterium]|nr:protein-methionine-sulfoxide reductase catalytic subunit MsrP [Acidobacteriota bacterium]
MLIRIPKGWETPEREATPEEVYHERRRFLKRTAVLAGLAAGAVNAWPGAAAWLRALAPEPPGLEGLRKLEAARNPKYTTKRPITAERIVAGYNNFYEFTTDKERVAYVARHFRARPWEVEITGEVEKPRRLDVDELIRQMPLEERVYRLRCVEAWSVVVPWVGFPLTKFVEWARPKSTARYLRMVTFWRPEEAPGQRSQDWYPWPYFEGLTMAEATNELAMIVVGSYGHILPNQNGAPLRLIVPWKYGFKSIKSIVKFEFTRQQPKNFWNVVAPQEYDFYANVNPQVPHPRWSQASEIDVATGNRIPTKPYNGYAEFVAHLYR